MTDDRLREALRREIPLLHDLPDDVFRRIDLSEIHLPASPDIRSARQELEGMIGHYVVTYDRGLFRQDISVDRHLCANVEGAVLSGEQRMLLKNAEAAYASKGISFVIYRKPVSLKATPGFP